MPVASVLIELQLDCLVSVFQGFDSAFRDEYTHMVYACFDALFRCSDSEAQQRFKPPLLTEALISRIHEKASICCDNSLPPPINKAPVHNPGWLGSRQPPRELGFVPSQVRYEAQEVVSIQIESTGECLRWSATFTNPGLYGSIAGIASGGDKV